MTLQGGFSFYKSGEGRKQWILQWQSQVFLKKKLKSMGKVFYTTLNKRDWKTQLFTDIQMTLNFDFYAFVDQGIC